MASERRAVSKPTCWTSDEKSLPPSSRSFEKVPASLDRQPLRAGLNGSEGSLIVRDLRLWHCGRPNWSPTPRVMLAFIHFAPWYRQRMTLSLPRTLAPIFDRHAFDLNVAVDWIEGEVDHLDGAYGNAFDFDQDA